jgi:hypothetical protein
LKVSSSIHPISTPTGTDDEKAGNDTLTSLLRWLASDGGVQRDFFFKPGHFEPLLTFYDISGPGLHQPGTRKSSGVAARCHVTAQYGITSCQQGY